MKRFQQAFTILGLLVALLLFTTTIGIDASEKVKLLPEKFLGSWDVDHSENFDEYLEAKGFKPIYNRLFLKFCVFKAMVGSCDKL